jgi:hypothetical protein
MAEVSKADLTALTKGIGKLTAMIEGLQPSDEPNIEDANEGNTMVVQDLDPSVTAFYNAEAKLVEELGNGGNTVLIRTKRGVTPVNRTEEALNALYDFGRDRKIFVRNRQIR